MHNAALVPYFKFLGNLAAHSGKIHVSTAMLRVHFEVGSATMRW